MPIDKKKISVLIIGAGNIAQKHIESLNSIKDFHIYGLYSRTFDRSHKLAIKFNIKNIFKNYEEIYEQKNYFDLILILVSPDQTLDVFLKIMKLKKVIFFEKPVGFNFSENKKILSLVKKFKLKTFVGFNRRYYSIFEKGLKKITSNNKKISSLIIEGHERLWLLNKIKKYNSSHMKNWYYLNSIHHVDLIRFFGGEIDLNYFYKISNKFSFSILLKSKKNFPIVYYSNNNFLDSWSVKVYNNHGEYLEFKPLEKGYFITHNSRKAIMPNINDEKYKSGFHKMHLNLKNFIKNNKLSFPDQSVSDAIISTNLVNKIFY